MPLSGKLQEKALSTHCCRAAAFAALAFAGLALAATLCLPFDGVAVLEVDGVASREVAVKSSHASCALGLLEASEDDACLLQGVSRIHCLGMKFPIDVVYLDPSGVVLRVETCLPGELGEVVDDAESVLELPAGSSAALGIDSGSRLEFA